MQTIFTVEPDYRDYELHALDVLNPLLDVVQVAVNAIHEAAQQRAEANYWRGRYNDDLSNQIRHNDAMMGNVLKAMLDRPVDAIIAAEGQIVNG
jgi:hypothetical protein